MVDNNCVLLEFPNESNNVAVGYRKWLRRSTEDTTVEQEFTDDELEDGIKTKSEFITKWPVGVEVLPPRQMNKLIEKKQKDLTWNNYVAHVLAFGEWTLMCSYLRNIEKTGSFVEQKEQRKIRCKMTDEKGEGDGAQSQVIDKKKKKHFNTKKADNLKMISEQKDLFRKYSKLDGSGSSEQDEESIASGKESDASSIDGSCSNRSKQSLQDEIFCLKEEIKRLRLRNAQLEALECVSKGLPQICEGVRLLKRKLVCYPDDSDKKKRQKSSIGEGSKPQNIHNRQDQGSNHTNKKDSLPNTPTEKIKSPESNGINNGNHEKTPDHSDTHANKPELFPWTPTKNSRSFVIDESNGIIEDVETYHNGEKFSPNTESSLSLIEEGNTVPTGKKDYWSIYNFSNVKTACGLSKYIADMLSVMFTNEELCKSSLTGTKGSRMKIDPDRLDFIRTEAKKKFFHGYDDEKKFTSAFNTAASQKLNNCRPSK